MRLRAALVHGAATKMEQAIFPVLRQEDDAEDDKKLEEEEEEDTLDDLPETEKAHVETSVKEWRGWRISYRAKEPENWEPTKFRQRMTRTRLVLQGTVPLGGGGSSHEDPRRDPFRREGIE